MDAGVTLPEQLMAIVREQRFGAIPKSATPTVKTPNRHRRRRTTDRQAAIGIFLGRLLVLLGRR